MKKIIFSGVQPTGNIHLGNYLGAIRNWVNIQNTGDTTNLFCVVDLHAITIQQDPTELRENILSTVATYIACGINPKKSIIFNQSAVSMHTELAWILSCHTPLGWLNRMTQFKEKAGKKRENAVLGLYGYPVLMAADVLGYNATHVPVGNDQKQHVELMRDIAGAFNHHYAIDFFTLPKPIITANSARIMSLRDGTKKMSKSDKSEYSRINLTDDADVISAKIRKAKTDAIEGIFTSDERPEISNLFSIYKAVGGNDSEFINMSAFKTILTDALIAHLSPIKSEIDRLMRDKAELINILQAGTIEAKIISEKKMNKIKEIVGFKL